MTTTTLTATEKAAYEAKANGEELKGAQKAAYDRAVKKIAAVDKAAAEEADARAAQIEALNQDDPSGIDAETEIQDADDADFVNEAEAAIEARIEEHREDAEAESAEGDDADETPAEAESEAQDDVPAAGITRNGNQGEYHLLKRDGSGVKALCTVAGPMGVARTSEVAKRTVHSVCAKLAVTQPFLRESDIDWSDPNRKVIESDGAPATKVQPKAEEIKANVEKATKAAKKTPKAAPKTTPKAAPAKKAEAAPKAASSERFRPAAAPGYETFLPKARGGVEIGFKIGDHKVIVLICTEHGTVKSVKSMGEARSDRRNITRVCGDSSHKH